MGRQQLLISKAKPPIPLNMKGWRLSWEHKFFIATLIASQVIGVISAFDCRFFIFHPECRGQYGKRSTLPALVQLPQPAESQNSQNLDLNPDLEDDTSLNLKDLLDYCSRYVFAPICRGVTSKRATISPLVGNNHTILDFVLRQIKKQQEENQKSGATELPKSIDKDNSQEDKVDIKDIEIDIKPLNKNGHLKRDSWDLSDLGGISSFYRKRMYKKSAPSIDDLQQERDNAMNALSSFTTFYKRNPLEQEPGSRFRRQALEDLGAFTTFMKKDPKFPSANNKRSTRSISREDLDSLDA